MSYPYIISSKREHVKSYVCLASIAFAKGGLRFNGYWRRRLITSSQNIEEERWQKHSLSPLARTKNQTGWSFSERPWPPEQHSFWKRITVVLGNNYTFMFSHGENGQIEISWSSTQAFLVTAIQQVVAFCTLGLMLLSPQRMHPKPHRNGCWGGGYVRTPRNSPEIYRGVVSGRYKSSAWFCFVWIFPLGQHKKGNGFCWTGVKQLELEWLSIKLLLWGSSC